MHTHRAAHATSANATLEMKRATRAIRTITTTPATNAHLAAIAAGAVVSNVASASTVDRVSTARAEWRPSSSDMVVDVVD